MFKGPRHEIGDDKYLFFYRPLAPSLVSATELLQNAGYLIQASDRLEVFGRFAANGCSFNSTVKPSVV